MSKLTKAQREFFSQFSRTAVANMLAPILEFKGVEITREQLEQALSTVDLTELTEAIGTEFLSRVEFKTLKKVDNFMKSLDFTSVVEASTEVNRAVNELILDAVAPLVPRDEVETSE